MNSLSSAFFTMQPIIGITCTTGIFKEPIWGRLAVSRVQHLVYEYYVNAVLGAGGAPMLLPFTHDQTVIQRMATTLNGLVLTGGSDIDPVYYQTEPHPDLGGLDPRKDALEVPLTQLALDSDLPILGICRGMQMLNVVGGGTLYQDMLAEKSKEVLKHFQQAQPELTTHSVTIAQGTLLAQILQQDHIRVTSYHHQAVKDVAPDFRVTAVAPDGIIEAIEHPSKRFVIGVQWHPEGGYQNDENSQRLFRALVEAAK